MSIADDIKARIAKLEGSRLYHLPPWIAGELSMRTMIVSKEVYECVTEFPDNWEGYKRSKFRGDLDAFTTGEEMSVAEEPHNKPPDTMMARIDPVSDEIWSIRNTDPVPGIRCLGAFGGIDLFIALTWDYRDGFDWNYEKARFEKEWKGLFAPIPRFKGASLDEYVSNYHAV